MSSNTELQETWSIQDTVRLGLPSGVAMAFVSVTGTLVTEGLSAWAGLAASVVMVGAVGGVWSVATAGT